MVIPNRQEYVDEIKGSAFYKTYVDDKKDKEKDDEKGDEKAGRQDGRKTYALKELPLNLKYPVLQNTLIRQLKKDFEFIVDIKFPDKSSKT